MCVAGSKPHDMMSRGPCPLSTWREASGAAAPVRVAALNPGPGQPPKKHDRKSKKSCELVMLSWLKSASPEKKSLRKLKKSWLLIPPLESQSHGHAVGSGRE